MSLENEKGPHLNPPPEGEEDTGRGCFGNQGGRPYAKRQVRVSARQISIIVPARNEAAGIRVFLEQLRERAAAAEIIVVDGASSDGTAEIARAWCDRLVETERGRARQMNAGALVAEGKTFWFLHADGEVPRDAIDQIQRVLRDPRNAGGYFRIQLPPDRFVYRLTDGFAHYAGLLLRIRFGDHGFFCRRTSFQEIGGFPEVPLMEDAEFFRKLRRRGRIAIIPSRLISSPRRYEKIGPWRLTLTYGVIALLYLLHVPIPVLAAIYQRRCEPPD
jgi:rSAM/selenodomain-associated transferase 2